jgi:hypothetical protein
MKARVGAFDSSRRIDNIGQQSMGGISQDRVITRRVPSAAQCGSDSVRAFIP